jgi:hypothetical protein
MAHRLDSMIYDQVHIAITKVLDQLPTDLDADQNLIQQPGLTPAMTLATAPPNGRELIATPCRPVRPDPHVPDVQDAMEGRGDGCRCT